MTERALSLLVYLMTFMLFALTSATGLGLIDSGELTAAAHTLGIAHPTGYPLYILLGKCWLMMNPLPPDRVMVLFGCAASAAAMTLLFLIASSLFRSTLPNRPRTATVAAAISACALACTSTVWQGSNYAEVYPLSLLASALLVYAGYRSLNVEDCESRFRYTCLTCFVWALGLGNHLTLLWYIPLIAWLSYRAYCENGFERGVIGYFALFIALGLSVYLILPLRSSVNPPLDWGDPQNLENLIRHLSAWQYRVWMFTGNFAQLTDRFFDYLRSTLSSLTIAGSILVCAGILSLLWRRAAFGIALLISWIIGLFYNLNYDIPDIHTYDLIFYPVLFVLLVYGIQNMIAFGKRHLPEYVAAYALLAVSVLVLVVPALAHYENSTKRNDRFARMFTTELLNSLPDSAVVLQGNWDIQSPTLYLQHVEQVRTDVTMLDLNLMQRSWYIAEQATLHPELFDVCRPLIKDFLAEVQRFERGEEYDGQTIETAFVDLHNCIIDNARTHRPVYLRDTQLCGHPDVGAGFPTRSTGYFVKILRDSAEANITFDLINPAHIAFNSSPSKGEQRLREEAALSMITSAETARSLRQLVVAESAAVYAGGFDPTSKSLKYLNRNIDITKTRLIQQ